MGGMLGGLETRMKRETDAVKQQLNVAVESIGDLGSRVDRAERRLDGLVDEVNLIVDKRMADKAEKISPHEHVVHPDHNAGEGAPRSLSSSYAAVTKSCAMEGPPDFRGKMINPGRKKEEDYWQCRRALRLRPIGRGEVHEEVRKFMISHLGLDEFFMESVGQFSAKRVPYGPAAKIRGEVIVSYQSTEVRDAVKSAAKNLAGKGSDYGVRLELPNHLKSAMSALQSASFELKSRYPQARRNVLFDDDALDLALDFCLEPEKDSRWLRMTSDQAKKRKKRTPGARQALAEAELDDLLDGPLPDPEREEESG